MSYPLAAVAAHDPRVQLEENVDVAAPEHFVLADGLAPNFETYLYYAEEQRDSEATKARRERQGPPTGWIGNLFGLNRLSPHQDSKMYADEKRGGSQEAAVAVTPAEYRAASSSLRTASWGAIFYLITTGTITPSIYNLYASNWRDRRPRSVLGPLCILGRRIWPRCCMLRRFRCNGSIQRIPPLAHVLETRFGQVPSQVFW